MTQALPLPPLEVLQEKFEYDPESGVLTWKKPFKKALINQQAGYPTQRGWLRVKVGSTHYRVHRIVWKMYYGEDPPVGMDLDHINRDKTDNRIANLRVVTRKENIANSARVLNKKPPRVKKTLEELTEIRANNARRTAEKCRKPVILISPAGEETWHPSITEAARTEKVNPSNLNSVLRGRRKAAQGFTARYA